MLASLSLACLVTATSPMASWCACWCLKTMVIQVEQEAIVSGIWALSTEAGHRSHEGANADSALVDWLRPCPPPRNPSHLTSSLLYAFPLFHNFLMVRFLHFLRLVVKLHLLAAGAIVRPGRVNIHFGMVARSGSNEPQPLPNTFHMVTLPWASLSWSAWLGAKANNR